MVTMNNSNLVHIATGKHGKHLLISQPAAQGATVCDLVGDEVPLPSRYTIQLGDHLHLSGDDRAWVFANHSCDPSCAIDTIHRRLIALRDLPERAEITFDYLTTEWELSSPFECGCDAPWCRGRIAGYRYLDDQERRRIIAITAPYLLELLHLPLAEVSARAQATGR
jgi:hypothetical protein